MAKLKKIAWPVENGEFIYLPKKVLDGIAKTANILKQYTVKGTGETTHYVSVTKGAPMQNESVEHDYRGRLVIEYINKKGKGHGKIELYDMGPDVPKK